MHKSPIIHVVGVEPEGPDPSRPPLSNLWEDCVLLCGGKRHIEGVSSHLRSGTRVIPVSTNIPEVLTVLKEFVQKGEGGVGIVLATGDPLYHGIGGTIVREVPRRHLVFTPATTLVQRAFALLGEAWENVKVASIHGKKEEPILEPGRWIFYTGGSPGPGMLVGMALRQGFRIGSMVVLEEIGLPGQKVTSYDSVSPRDLEGKEFQTLNMVVMTLEK